MFTIALRVFLFELPETGGDAVANWSASHRLLSGEHGTIALKYSRLGIQIPVALLILLFGSHPFVYHLAPIIFSAVSSICVYFLVRKVSNTGIAILAAFIFILFPPFDRNGIQLIPGIFQCTYLLLAIVILVKLIKKPSGLKAVLLGVAVFLSYATKFTGLFILPGVLIALVIGKIPKKIIFTFILSLVVLYGVEHVFFAAHGWPLGRVEMLVTDKTIRSLPAEESALWEINKFSDFFNRYSYRYLRIHWWLMYLYFIPCVILLILFGNRVLRAIAVVPISHLFLNTFLIQSTDPIMTVTRPIRRYNSIYAGVMVVVISVCLYVLARKLGKLFKDRTVYARVMSLSPILAIIVLSPVLKEFSVSKYNYINRRIEQIKNSEYPLELSSRYYKLVNQAYSNNIPIITDSSWTRQRITAVRDVYLKKESWSSEYCENLFKHIKIEDKDFLAISGLPQSDLDKKALSLQGEDEVVWVSESEILEIRKVKIKNLF